MNRFTSTLIAAALMSATTLAFADHDRDHDTAHHDATHHDMKHHDHMSTMDANGDGLISKDEFMNFHAAHWDKMPKNKDGLVAIKDMHPMHSMQHMHDGMKKGCKDMDKGCKEMDEVKHD